MAYIRYPGATSSSISFPLTAPDGSAAAPSYSFSSSSSTGMYYSATQINFSVSGTLRYSISTTAVTSTLPHLSPSGSVSAPTYANSTGKTGVYFNGETGRFSGNQVNMGGWSGTAGWSLGINGFNTNTVVTVDGSAWLASAAEIAVYVQHQASATATSSVSAFKSDVTTSANAFTCAARYGFLSNDRAKGAGSTITRDIAFGGNQPTQGGTANVMLTDNASMTGNFFLHQSGTTDNVLGGNLKLNRSFGWNYQRVVPITGFTQTINDNISQLILTPAGTIATGTVTMPANPFDGQIVGMSTNQTITSLTISPNSGQTITGAPATLVTTSAIRFIYILTDTNWYRC